MQRRGIEALLLLLVVATTAALHVNSLWPRRGSLAGGTKVTIYGGGFSGDPYDTTNVVFFGDTPCDVDWFNSGTSTTRIVCWTRPYVEAREDSSSSRLTTRVYVGPLSQTYTSTSYRRFRHEWGVTPYIETVSPRSGPAGYLVVQIRGRFLAWNDQWVNSIRIGSMPCEIYKPNTALPYRDWRHYLLEFALFDGSVGFFNISVDVREYGRSWNHSKALHVAPSGDLYMIEIHPDVQSVYPAVGSAEGGTVVQIEGSGFGSKIEDVDVDVDGIPCKVLAVSYSTVTCETGRPPNGSNVIVGVNGTFDGEYFEGSRGVTMKYWGRLDGITIAELRNSPSYPHSPDRYHNLENFISPVNFWYRYGIELEAIFTASYSSLHTFFLASDDYGELWFSSNTNASAAKRIASIVGHTSVDQFDKFPSQIAEPVYLEKGQKCYLKAIAKEHTGGDFAQVAVLVHDTPHEYKSSQTKDSIHEKQRLIVRTEFFHEVHAIHITEYNGGDGTLTLTWDGYQSDPIALPSTNEDVRGAVLSLFTGVCSDPERDSDNPFGDVRIAYGFESGSGGWTNEGYGSALQQTIGDAYCGRGSLLVVSGYASVVVDEEGYDVFNYDSVCMAYKIPSGTHSTLFVDVQDIGRRLVLLTNDPSADPNSVLGEWRDIGDRPLIANNTWSYSCFSLLEALQGRYPSETSFIVTKIGFLSPEPEYRNGPFRVDEFSIRTSESQLQDVRVRPAAYPNGLLLEDVIVTNTTSNSTATYYLEYVPTNCFDEFTLIGATVTSDVAGMTATASRFRAATEALDGSFRVNVFGNWSWPIAHDANEAEMLDAFNVSSVGEITIQAAMVDGSDHRGCQGRQWDITFNDLVGDQVPLEVNGSRLTGTNVTVDVEEVLTGGLFFNPIPGHMLRTVEKTPQVRVSVKGIRSSCKGSGEQYSKYHGTRYSHNTSCTFIYSSDAQPVVTTFSPSVGQAGTILTWQGSAFSSDVGAYEIKVGELPCDVLSANETTVTCQIGDYVSGLHPVSFRILTLGTADTTGLFFNYTINVEAVNPSSGSLGGGVEIVINGTGFADCSNDNDTTTMRVYVGENECKVIDCSFAVIRCIVPASNSSGAATVVVEVEGGGRAEFSSFTYSDALTPQLHSIEPESGSAGGGTRVVLNGTRFSSDISQIRVKIGSSFCDVLVASANSIECTTNPHSDGSARVSVFVTGLGDAVGDVDYQYELFIDSMTHHFGSIFGGQRLRISGGGFSTENKSVQVLLGDDPCDIESTTPSLIQCVTGSSSRTHHVDNSGRHLEYGRGYQWQPSHLVVHVGDSVKWTWTGSAFTTLRSVVQVADGKAETYDGTGFKSKESVRGSFVHAFTKPGLYHYISAGLAHIGFRGTVEVKPYVSKTVNVAVLVNGIPASHQPSAVNKSQEDHRQEPCLAGNSLPANCSTTICYTYSTCHTPVIVKVTPSDVRRELSASVVGSGFAGLSAGDNTNTLTIGGKACLASSNARLASNVSDEFFSSSDVDWGTVINCTLPQNEPGKYRVVLHVASRGWAFGNEDAASVEYKAAITGPVGILSGSLAGGTKLTIPGVGFHSAAAEGNIVHIGNTPCAIQALRNGNLVCITEAALDHGYDALRAQCNSVNLTFNWAQSERLNVGLGQESFSDSIATRFSRSYASAFVNVSRENRFAVEIWAKPSRLDSGRQFLFGSHEGGGNVTTKGFFVWINACGYVEFWLGNTSDVQPPCQGDDSCNDCSGVYNVLPDSDSDVPAGDWSVLRAGPLSASVWNYVGVSWVKNRNSSTGVQSLFINGNIAVSRETTADLDFSGGRYIYLGGQENYHENSSWFIGDLDEMSVYESRGVDDMPLTEEKAAKHFFYGNSSHQPLTIQAKTGDYRGKGVIPNVEYPPFPDSYTDVNITWSQDVAQRIHVQRGDRLQFSWVGFHNLVQVNEKAFVSCLLRDDDDPVQWGWPQSDGTATVADLEEGRVHYFVSSVGGDCYDGFKLKVFVGSESIIDWTLGQVYPSISVPYGTGIHFRWDSPNTVHDVIEVVSEQALRDCAVTSQDYALGRIVASYSEPTRKGDVAITDLKPGIHYFACAVGSGRHCERGMKITVKVEEQGSIHSGGREASVRLTDQNQWLIDWRIQQYEDLTIVEGDSVIFTWDAFHSLHQVTKDKYDACDMSGSPLKEWSRGTVGESVTISGLAPGRYYFVCSIAGHCDLGMKIAINVQAEDYIPLHEFTNAVCSSPYCSFGFDLSETPQVERIWPWMGPPGTTLTINGTRFGSSVEVVVGNSLCENVNVTSADGYQLISCAVPHQAAGRKGLGVSSKPEGRASNVDGYHFTVQAKASSVSPTGGSLAGGTIVTIAGVGFSYNSEEMDVTMGQTKCQILSSSFTVITCITHSHSGGDTVAPINVIVQGTPAESSLNFTFETSKTPQIFNVTGIDSAGVAAGDIIDITGVNFGSNASVYVIRQSGAQTVLDALPTAQLCPIITASDNAIQCEIKQRVAGLTYRLLVDNLEYGFSATRDVAYRLNLASASPITFSLGGGVNLTLTGVGFVDDVGSQSSDSPLNQFSAVDASVAPLTLDVMGNRTALGGIDYGVTFGVSICGRTCYVQSSSYDAIVCTVPPADGESVAMSSSDLTDKSCDVAVHVTGPSGKVDAVGASPLTYSAAATPIISSVSPRRGGTGGGTTVSVTGSGLANITEGLHVSIDGVPCDIKSSNDSLITCRSGAHQGTVKTNVVVVVGGKGAAVSLLTANGTLASAYEYVDRWSSRFTWGGNDPPGDGESVHIPEGQTVLLDTSPAGILNLIVVQGQLIFDDSTDLFLNAKYIFINGGGLQIGTEDEPFMHRAVITLHGNIRDPEIPIYGAKVLGLRRGFLELHGRPTNITWTRLAQTVQKNTSSLYLIDAVDWEKGNVIVIASTSKDGNETETATIESVSDGGKILHLYVPVNFTHYGITDVMEDGQFIDIRAEVGLLSHNVIVQGSLYEGDSLDELGADQYGSQIMIHRAGSDPTPIRLENVEIRQGGQAFRLGRYAVHFHLSDVMNGSYVRHCAIHHSNNRAITAHGVHEMLFEGNVAYNIKGHTFFIEDGIETGNHYIRNLGLLTKGSSSLLNTDQLPATFWITNPNNTFIGNAAAGSRAYGFWYDLDPHPVGPSATSSVCPNKTPFGVFRDNVAHTNAEFGLRIWETYTPKEFGCGGGKDVDAVFENLVTYSNGIHGLEFSVIGHVKIVGFKVADNRDSGIEIQEAYGTWGGPIIKDTLIISHTVANQGRPQTTGIRTPNQRLLVVSNVTFARFDSDEQNCLRACSHCKVRQGGYQYWFENITFLDNSSYHKAGFQWEHEVLFRDLDGTLSGTKGNWVTPTSGLLPNQSCTQRPEFSMNQAVPGSVCTSDVDLLRLAWNRVEPLATFRGRDVLFQNEHGSSLIPWRHYRLTHMDGYMLTLPSQNRHNLTYDLPSHLDTDATSFNAGMYNVQPRDAVILEAVYDTEPDHFKIGSNRKDIGRRLRFSDNHTSWHFDNKTMAVEYILSGKGKSQPLSDLIYSFSKEPCPVSGCPVPDVGGEEGYESTWRRWSNPSHWPNNAVPSSGDDVVIEKKWRMYLDVPEVNVSKLEILGKLQVEDQRDVVINATWILLLGANARFYVGDKENAFSHRATINLQGDRNTEEIRYGRNLNVGSKAIGVFGELFLRGSQRTVDWTHLERTATVGSTDLHLDASPDWKPGDKLVVTSTTYDPEQTEIVTVQSVVDAVVTLTKPLQFDHHVETFLSGADASSAHSRWQSKKLAAEVGLLSRNVRVVGAEDDKSSISVHGFGCRVIIGALPQGRLRQYGKAYIDGVEFSNCGQGGFTSNRDPRYVVVFLNGLSEMGGSYVRHSSIHTGFNTGFGALNTNGIEFSDNVVYQSIGPTFQLRADDSKVTGNLGVMTLSIQVARPADNHAVDFPATFEISGTGNIIRDNVAAAYQRIGFIYPGEPCVDGAAPNASQALFWGNSAHTGMTGLVVMGLSEPCTGAGGFTAARQWEYGVFAWTASSLAFRELAVAVGHTGLCLNVFGPDPVKHFFERKSVRVDGSFIVGTTDAEPCMNQVPNHCPSVCSTPDAAKLGIMMSTFSKKRGKMDGTGPWHKPKSYPAIRGQVNFTDTTFANFVTESNMCGKKAFAIGNNKLSPDAMHPNYFRLTNLINVLSSRLAHMYPPDPAWIVQEDCVDMDCDGPKHSIVHDLDGTLVTTAGGKRGSIVPQAELRFANYIDRLPETMLYDESDPTTRLKASDVVQSRGIARGENGNFANPIGGCKFEADWNAYRCSEINHQMLIVESMDADSETRRISPIALHGGDLGTGPYTDLLNGPMDHGWCTYYTCLKRLSTFYTVVALGTEYHLWFTGSNPGHFRFHLLNTIGGTSDHPGEGIKLSIWYKNPQRKDVYKDGIFLEPENFAVQGKALTSAEKSQFVPKLASSHSGANFFDRSSQVLHLIVKGDKPIDVILPPVVQVSFALAVSLDDFFDPSSLVQNLAFVLKIPLSMIRVVDVIAEDTPERRKRAVQQTYDVTFEIGSEPVQNITQEKAPNITEQIDSDGGQGLVDNDDDSADNDTAVPVVLPTGFFQPDDAPPVDDIASDFLSASSQYQQSLSDWQDVAAVVSNINSIANDLVNQVQSGLIDFGNASVVSFSVAPAEVPALPPAPVIPPGLDNLTLGDGQSVFDQSAVPTLGSVVVPPAANFSVLKFQIPAGAKFMNQPEGKSSHLVYIVVMVQDSNGDAVENLGLTVPWTCNVSIAKSSGASAVLEGQTSASFASGYAHFTSLRIDSPLDAVQLQLNIEPGGYILKTNEFAVVAPDVNSLDSTSISFVLQGDFESTVLKYGLDAFLSALQTEIASAANVHASRIVNLDARRGSIVCMATILDSTPYDPPSTLSLSDAVDRLEDAVESGRFEMNFRGVRLAALSSTFTKDTDRTKSSVNVGLIAGIAAGGSALLIIIGVILFIAYSKMDAKRKKVADNRWARSVSPQEKVALRGNRDSPNVDMEMHVVENEMNVVENDYQTFDYREEIDTFKSPMTQTSVASLGADLDQNSPDRLTPVGVSPTPLLESEYPMPSKSRNAVSPAEKPETSPRKMRPKRVSTTSSSSGVRRINVTPKQSVSSESESVRVFKSGDPWKY